MVGTRRNGGARDTRSHDRTTNTRAGRRGAHHARARPFLDAGLPCFIDKPFTCGVADARKIAELSARREAPVFSSSSLRYAPELVAFNADPDRGKILGVESYGPAPYFEGK